MGIAAWARRRATIGLILLGLVVPSAACAKPSPDLGDAVGLTMQEALFSVVAATRSAGTTVLAEAPRAANVVTSPSSLMVALAMLAEGARGTSLAELEAVLGASGDGRREAIAALRAALLVFDGDPAVVQQAELPQRPLLHMAGQVVVDDGYPVDPAYLKALTDGFGAGVQNADLATEAGKQVLSDWIDHHTGGLIKESAIKPDPDLRLVLQDAILLAARWAAPFSSYGTAARPFSLPDGTEVMAETMTSHDPVAYAEVDGWTAARLPYTGGHLAADLLLPPVGVDPAEVTPELLARVSAALDDSDPKLVDLSLPTLDLKPDPLDLLGILPELGASSVVCGAPNTDLSGVGPGNLCVLQAFQQAVLKVDEEGTVAAAVTEIGIGVLSGSPAPEKVLHLDRPFLFQVVHTETAWPLFLAAVRDPGH